MKGTSMIQKPAIPGAGADELTSKIDLKFLGAQPTDTQPWI
jgi:hypothetical protein